METTRQSRGSGLGAIAETTAVAVLAFLVALVAGVVFVVPLITLGYDVASTSVLVGATAAGQLGMLLVGYAYYRFRDVPVSLSVPSLAGVGYVVAGIVLAVTVAVLASLGLAALDLLPSSVVGEVGLADPTYLLGLAALSVVVVAPVEEFVFRGVVQGRLRDRFGPVPAIVGASLLFGSMHLANYSGRPVPIVAGALLIAAVGSVFGALYERTGNLAVPVAVHAGYNTILLVTSYLALSYA